MTHRRPARTAGVTLIELLVALVLGLLVSVAVINAYLGSSRAAHVADAQARMNDDAAAVLSLLSANIRMAGNNPERPFRAAASARNPVYGSGGPAFALRGCDFAFANVASANRIDDLACPTTGGRGNSVAITYEADVFNTAAGGAAPLDCVGAPLPAVSATVTVYDPVSEAADTVDVTYYWEESRFYLVRGGDGVSRLMCWGNGTGSQPGVLAENVEDLQFAFGLAPPAATSRNVAGYLPAGGIASHPALASLDERERWAKAVSVRVCILLRSSQPVVEDDASARYFDCAGALVAAPDRHLRRAYRTTIVVRGRT